MMEEGFRYDGGLEVEVTDLSEDPEAPGLYEARFTNSISADMYRGYGSTRARAVEDLFRDRHAWDMSAQSVQAVKVT